MWVEAQRLAGGANGADGAELRWLLNKNPPCFNLQGFWVLFNCLSASFGRSWMTPVRTTCTWVTGHCPALLMGCQWDGVWQGRDAPVFWGDCFGVGSLWCGLDVPEELIPSNSQRKRDPVGVQKGDWSAL